MTTTLTEPSPARRPGSDFAPLSRAVAEAGLMRRRPGYYAVRLTLVIGTLLTGWAGFLVLGDSPWQLLLAVGMGLAFGQLALAAHDVAHRQVFRGRGVSELAGRLIGNLGIGMSYGWWMNKHTRHHANPNHEELDPDVSPEILVWSQRQAKASQGVPRFIGRHQAWLFFPLLTLEGFNLHVSSVRALWAPTTKRRLWEGLLLGAHIVGYLVALFWVLDWGLALGFLAIHQAVFGVYLGCAFAPNHKGMPTLTGDDRPDFLRRQVLTSRNVSGGWFTDLALGGLNHQIEHHLFPNMPSPHLRRAKPLVRAHCERLGIPYHETGLVASWREALTHLHQVGAPLRDER
ncbi:acyl-CoA desaturase [Streptomyces sp. NPDC005438]|uniref:fatty acid desaturase family protein n=1 Tax=Streptomyces sp. NPDC005438 TaxID=3156880 RepID=UPI0033BF3DEE